MNFNKVEETIEIDIQKIEKIEEIYGSFNMFQLGSNYRSLLKKIKRDFISSSVMKKIIKKIIRNASIEELNKLLNDLQTEKRIKISLKELKSLIKNNEMDDTLSKAIIEIVTKE